jgi:hypothetical protein
MLRVYDQPIFWILPAAFAGVFGLLKLPNGLLLFVIYTITQTYGCLWALDKTIDSPTRESMRPCCCSAVTYRVLRSAARRR